MIKIAFASVLPLPGQIADSGVPKVSRVLLDEFKQRDDVSVSVIVPSRDVSRVQEIQDGALRVRYFPVGRYTTQLSLYIPSALRIRRYLRDSDPDIIHAQPNEDNMLAALWSGRPHVITLHGLLSAEAKGYSRLHPLTVRNNIRARMQKYIARNAGAVISISPYITSYVRSVGLATIREIPNPVDPEFFGLDCSPGGRGRVLCIGTLSRRKNQIALIRAIGYLRKQGRDLKLRLVGVANPGIVEELTSAIDDLRVRDLVEIVGPVSDTELRMHYDWCDVVALASLEETAPLSLLQGLAAGRMVAGARSGGIPAQLGHGQLGALFDPNSIEDIGSTLLSAISDRDIAGRNRRRQSTFETYSPASVAEATISLYREIAEARGVNR